MQRKRDMYRRKRSPSPDSKKRKPKFPRARKPKMECSPEEFRSKVENFFRPLISAARSSGNFDRTCFRMAPQEFPHHLKCPELAAVYYSYVLEECTEFFTSNWTTIFSTLQEYLKNMLVGHDYEPNPTGGYHHFTRGTEKMLRNHRYRVSSSDEDMPYDLREQMRLQKLNVPYFEVDLIGCTLEQLIYKPFIYQDLKCIKVLVRYIMPGNFATDDLSKYSEEVLKLMGRDPKLGNLTYCNSLVERYNCSLSARRRKLLLMSFDFVAQYRCAIPYSQNSINNLKHLFETLPDPRIASDEVRKFLLSIMKDVDRDAEILINDFCKSFEEEYPGSALPLQPRSLKHLCKCQIRRSLTLANVLPVGVGRLDIPDAMQKYISLDVIEEVPDQNMIVD